jgi:hypothetical protein
VSQSAKASSQKIPESLKPGAQNEIPHQQYFITSEMNSLGPHSASTQSESAF